MIKVIISFISMIAAGIMIIGTSPDAKQISGNGINPLALLFILLFIICSIFFLITSIKSTYNKLSRINKNYKIISLIISFTGSLFFYLWGSKQFNELHSQLPRLWPQYIIPLPFKVLPFWVALILAAISIATLFSIVKSLKIYNTSA